MPLVKKKKLTDYAPLLHEILIILLIVIGKFTIDEKMVTMSDGISFTIFSVFIIILIRSITC